MNYYDLEEKTGAFSRIEKSAFIRKLMKQECQFLCGNGFDLRNFSAHYYEVTPEAADALMGNCDINLVCFNKDDTYYIEIISPGYDPLKEKIHFNKTFECVMVSKNSLSIYYTDSNPFEEGQEEICYKMNTKNLTLKYIENLVISLHLGIRSVLDIDKAIAFEDDDYSINRKLANELIFIQAILE